MADALSRVTGSPSLHALFLPHSTLWDQIRATMTSHPYMLKVSRLATEKPGEPYLWKNGLIFYKNRVVIPPQSDLTTKLLQEFHDSPCGGHSGVLRTYKRLAQQFFWPSMRDHIQEYIAACSVCQKNKALTSSPAGLLQPLPIPEQVWDDITMDFIDGLPSSHGKKFNFSCRRPFKQVCTFFCHCLIHILLRLLLRNLLTAFSSTMVCQNLLLVTGILFL